MIIKKIILSSLTITSLFTLSSWTTPLPATRSFVPHTARECRSQMALVKERRDYERSQHQIRKEHKHLARQVNKLHAFTDRDGFIWFYDDHNSHTFFLSNFYPCKIRLWGMEFRCAEAAFQAAKFANHPKLFQQFAHLKGEEAWKFARQQSYQQRADWYQARELVMREILKAKFEQNPDLAELLLATGDAYLVEHTKKDAFWADGGDGKGKNRLGHLLMELRGKLGGVGSMSKPAKYRQFAR